MSQHTDGRYREVGGGHSRLHQPWFSFASRYRRKMGKGRSCGSWDAPGGGKGWGEDGGCGDRRVTGTGQRGSAVPGGRLFLP